MSRLPLRSNVLASTNDYNPCMDLKIPTRVARSARRSHAGTEWLERLPRQLASAQRRWALTCGEPIDNEEISCAWVASVTLADGTPAMLKLGMPHFEAEQETLGLRFWDGEPTVRLLAEDADLGAMLIERCQPGTPLRALPEQEQDVVIAGLLCRLWRSPSTSLPFRPLSALMKHWSEETLADRGRWADAGLVQEGLRLFEELPRTASTAVLLATDLHSSNVLRAEREPWLVIDPKPFVGDPAYDCTQHLFNCTGRLRSDPRGTIHRLADLLGVDPERIRLWTFARAAAEPRDNWHDEAQLAIAHATCP